MATFVLFVTSYLPLFLLIIFKQVVTNSEYLHFGGVNTTAITCLLAKFGISIILSIVGLLGYWGFKKTIQNIEQISDNGYPVIVEEVNNKNSEAIGYMATYIIPFLFENFTGWFESVSILFLLIIIYRIYINSSLILVNPILNIYYSIYEIEYKQGSKTRKGMIITKDKSLQEDTQIKIYEIGHKLFFSKNLN